MQVRGCGRGGPSRRGGHTRAEKGTQGGGGIVALEAPTRGSSGLEPAGRQRRPRPQCSAGFLGRAPSPNSAQNHRARRRLEAGSTTAGTGDAHERGGRDRQGGAQLGEAAAQAVQLGSLDGCEGWQCKTVGPPFVSAWRGAEAPARPRPPPPAGMPGGAPASSSRAKHVPATPRRPPEQLTHQGEGHRKAVQGLGRGGIEGAAGVPPHKPCSATTST